MGGEERWGGGGANRAFTGVFIPYGTCSYDVTIECMYVTEMIFSPCFKTYLFFILFTTNFSLIH